MLHLRMYLYGFVVAIDAFVVDLFVIVYFSFALFALNFFSHKDTSSESLMAKGTIFAS